jgi:hypothetical protein
MTATMPSWLANHGPIALTLTTHEPQPVTLTR